MKKIALAATLCFAIITGSIAQSAKFEPAMKKTLTELDSAKTGEDLQNVSNSFERIATAEKDQWLPYYYAAYAQVMKTYMEKDKSKIDPAIDKTDLLLANAEALSQNNSEITTLKAMATQCRMMVDYTRGMTLGPKCNQLIKEAEKQNPDNPRAWMFDAQTAYNTPTAFGGSKDKGKELLKKSVELYSTFKPQADLYPNWGKEYAEGVLAGWNK